MKGHTSTLISCYAGLELSLTPSTIQYWIGLLEKYAGNILLFNHLRILFVLCLAFRRIASYILPDVYTSVYEQHIPGSIFAPAPAEITH
jgi:hypothetical protein